MDRYAINERTISEVVNGGGLLVVAQWEAREGQADRIADILSRFLPEAQSEPGAKALPDFQSEGKIPPQFLFYELVSRRSGFQGASGQRAISRPISQAKRLPLLAKTRNARSTRLL